MRTHTINEDKAIRIPRLWIALLIAGSFSYAHTQQAAGRLFVYGNLQASYYAEARSERFVSIGQGVAEGQTLRLMAQPGPVVLRVYKANSGSARYSIVVEGGKNDVRVRDLAYGATVTVQIPESNSCSPLALYVIPD